MSRSFLLPPVDTVTFGTGAFGTLEAAVHQAGGTRVVAILSSSLAGGPVEEKLREHLGPTLVGVYSKTAQHVPRGSVLEALEVARSVAADCVVSVGGGTPIDCAKAVALGLSTGVTEPKHLDRYRIQFTYPDTRVVPEIDGEVVPHVAVPTTLSGGEHTGLCGITDEATLSKDVYSSPKLQPATVLLDPWVSAGTPDWLWAASGIRAVDHAVEGILSSQHLPITDALGAAALKLLSENLAHSARYPEDEDARTSCLLATWMSIYGLTNVGVGLSHGIGHQLAATFDMLHGVSSAIMLPRVMEFTRDQTLPRLRLVADALGVDTRDLDDRAAADLAISSVRELIRSVAVPDTISAAGGSVELLPGIADRAMHDASVASCPRTVSREDVLDLLKSAW